MTYIVNDACIACKYTDCVEVCPVDCFYEGENTLVIHPDECIDCGVCEPECPADAIRPDTEPDMEKWVEFNRKYSEMWPVIISKKDPMPEAEEREQLDELLDRHAREEQALNACRDEAQQLGERLRETEATRQQHERNLEGIRHQLEEGRMQVQALKLHLAAQEYAVHLPPGRAHTMTARVGCDTL